MDLGIVKTRALVLGGTGQIGLAIADQLAQEGCNLILVARDKSKLLSACDELQTRHRNVEIQATALDLAHEDQRQRLIHELESTQRIPQVVVNTIAGAPFTPSASAKDDHNKWLTAFHGKLLSYIRICELILPHIKRLEFGRLINIVGVSGAEPLPGLLVQGVVNAALSNFSKAIANTPELCRVTINCVHPGYIQSERFEQFLAGDKPSWCGCDSASQVLSDAIPARRLGTVNEVAALVCFLASKQAGYINGTSISVDGGLRRGVF